MKLLAKELALFWSAAFLIASPWLLKNWFFYHDPLYPFLTRFFPGAPPADVKALIADTVPRNLAQALTSWGGAKDFLMGLWAPQAYVHDSLGLAAPLLLPCLLLRRWQGRCPQLLMIFIGLWTTWALYSRMPRFFMPAVPFLCILAAGSIAQIRPRGLRPSGMILSLYGLLVNFSGLILLWFQMGLWQVPLHLNAKSDYLNQDHPGYNVPYYAGIEFINKNLPTDAVVLFVGEERGYYCRRKFIAASIFDVNPLVEAADSSSGPEEIYSRLKSLGVSHLLLNNASHQLDLLMDQLNPEGRKNLTAFTQKHLKTVFEDKKPWSWVRVIQILP